MLFKEKGYAAGWHSRSLCVHKKPRTVPLKQDAEPSSYTGTRVESYAPKQPNTVVLRLIITIIYACQHRLGVCDDSHCLPRRPIF